MDLHDPISPELVLVSPELRERVLAGLSDPEFSHHLAEVWQRARRPPEPPAPRPGPGTVARHGTRLLLTPVAVSVLITAVTLALTLVADSLR